MNGFGISSAPFVAMATANHTDIDLLSVNGAFIAPGVFLLKFYFVDERAAGIMTVLVWRHRCVGTWSAVIHYIVLAEHNVGDSSGFAHFLLWSLPLGVAACVVCRRPRLVFEVGNCAEKANTFRCTTYGLEPRMHFGIRRESFQLVGKVVYNYTAALPEITKLT